MAAGSTYLHIKHFDYYTQGIRSEEVLTDARGRHALPSAVLFAVEHITIPITASVPEASAVTISSIKEPLDGVRGAASSFFRLPTLSCQYKRASFH